MDDDGRSVLSKRGVSIGMVEVPMRINQPARRLMKHRGDGAAYLSDARAIARVDNRAFLGGTPCRYRSAGSHKSENLRANLGYGERSALVRSPREVDQPSCREAMAAIHAKGGSGSLIFRHLSADRMP
jgi:hypothetical protein